MPPETLLPCCPLCDEPIEVYDAASIYVEDGYKALAHEDCVAGEDEDEFDLNDDDDVDLESLSDYDPDEDDEDDDNY